MNNKNTISLVLAITALVSLLPLPYGFYFITRTIFTVGLGVISYRLYERRMQAWLVGAGFVILYNPLFPVHLGSKGLWAIVNIISIAYAFHFERKTSGLKEK